MDEAIAEALAKIDVGALFAEPTPQERMARVVVRLKQHQDNLRSAIRAGIEAMLVEIYQSPDGLTAQQVFDMLGPRGGTVLQLMSILWPLLVKAFPETQLRNYRPEGVELIVGEDGRVTVKGA